MQTVSFESREAHNETEAITVKAFSCSCHYVKAFGELSFLVIRSHLQMIQVSSFQLTKDFSLVL